MMRIFIRLKKMHESGLIGKWTSDRMPTKDQCWEGFGTNNHVNNHKVDVWDMQGIFFVLFIGKFYNLLQAFLSYHFTN